jgi:lysophospholipase L1-like esterase
VYAIGDSVMLGARSCLEKRGYVVNAQGSRQASAVATVLRHRRDRLPANVVVHTGTNGGATAADLRRIVKAVGPGHEIYFVTVQLPENGKYTFEARTNAAIEKVAKRFPNVHVADWNKRSNGHGRLTYGDGIHLPPAGCRAFAHVVADALRDA